MKSKGFWFYNKGILDIFNAQYPVLMLICFPCYLKCGPA